MGCRTFDDILVAHIRPMGKWQYVIFIIINVCSQIPFIFYGTLAHDPPPHRCYIKFLDGYPSNFTSDQVETLAIPYKPPNQPPMIGESYQPCQQYDLPYKMLSKLSFAKALVYKQKLEKIYRKGLPRIGCYNGYVYDRRKANYANSVGEEFGLVCDKAPVLAFMTSIYMFGTTAGLLIAGYVADWLGRKPALIIFGFANLLFAYSISLCTSVNMYALMRFLLALSSSGHMIVGFILCMEITDDYYRSILNTILVVYYCFFARGLFTLSAYLIQQWRTLSMALGMPLILAFLYPTSFITESPRWLLSCGRVAEANVIIDRAIKLNRGKDYYETNLNRNAYAFTCSVSSFDIDAKSRAKKRPLLTRLMTALSVLFLTRKVRHRFITGAILFSCQVTLYYGVSFYAIHVKGNPYLISFMEGFMGIPASVFLYYLYKWYLRRGPMMVMHLLSTIVCLLSALILMVKGSGSILVVILANIVICFEETTFNMLYVFFPEVFPTEIRNTGLSSASAISRSVGMIAFYIEELDKTVWLPLPMLIFAFLGLLMVGCTYHLPETKGHPMIDTIVELECDRQQLENRKTHWDTLNKENDQHALI